MELFCFSVESSSVQVFFFLWGWQGAGGAVGHNRGPKARTNDWTQRYAEYDPFSQKSDLPSLYTLVL